MIEIGLQMTMIFENVLSDMLLKAANMTSKSAGAKGSVIPIIKITVNDLCCSIKSLYFFKRVFFNKEKAEAFAIPTRE